jgi:hypothetical protein
MSKSAATAVAAAGLGAFALILAVGNPVKAATPLTYKCSVGLKKAVAKKVACELKADAKAETTSGNDEAVDFSACATKFAAAVAKAQTSKGGCATTVSGATLESKVDNFVDDVIDEITGSPSGAFLD